MKSTIAPISIALCFLLSSCEDAAGNGGGGDRDCRDFNSQSEAQSFFVSIGPGDPHNLDADNDGIACEHLRGNPFAVITEKS